MRRLAFFFGFLIAVSLCFSACKSKPALAEGTPPPVPSAVLFLNGIEADNPNLLKLSFTLEIRNPTSSAMFAQIGSWQAEVNGRKAGAAIALDTGGAAFPLSAAARGKASIPLLLNMDMAALTAEGLAPLDDYQVDLTIALGFSTSHEADSGSSFPFRSEASCRADFPGVRAPEFSITGIAILQAELINTRFRVSLRIENPNPFPIDLSAFSYTLYGNGKFWADGTEKNIIKVAAKSSLHGNLFLLMNFIDMDRNLLDQIVNLLDVNYRFRGEANISTGVDYLPVFTSGFDLSGYSVVLDE